MPRKITLVRFEVHGLDTNGDTINDFCEVETVEEAICAAEDISCLNGVIATIIVRTETSYRSLAAVGAHAPLDLSTQLFAWKGDRATVEGWMAMPVPASSESQSF